MSSLSDVPPAPPSRKDARRNRQRILDAARCLFAMQGADAPIDAVATRAGVGNATLYRHFPTRGALIAALLAGEYCAFHRALDESLAHEDAWQGLSAYLEWLCAMQASEHALGLALILAVPGDPHLETARELLRDKTFDLITRAQTQGTLRGDVTPEDLALIAWGTAGVITATGRTSPDVWRRYLALTLQGLRAEGARPLPQPPLTQEQHFCASARSGGPAPR